MLYYHTSDRLQDRFARQEPVPPSLGRVLIRPRQHGIVINTLMRRPPPGPGLRLPLQIHIRRTHYPLPQVIETMRRVVRYLFVQRRAPVPRLEVRDYVGQAVELVEYGHHVRGTLGSTVYEHCEGRRERGVGGVGG